MGALFGFLTALVAALATAAFAHFGVAVSGGEGDRASAEPPRAVKRSPVPAAATQNFVTLVRR